MKVKNAMGIEEVVEVPAGNKPCPLCAGRNHRCLLCDGIGHIADLPPRGFRGSVIPYRCNHTDHEYSRACRFGWA